MNNISTAEELTARVRTLIREGSFEAAFDLCAEYANSDDRDLALIARLLTSYCRAAQGDGSAAVSEHRDAMENAEEIGPFERLSIADEAMDAELPLDYCAGLYRDAGDSLAEDDDMLILAAGAYNKAGICLYRLGAYDPGEELCFRQALSAAERAEPDDEGRREVLRGLIMSNLAECLMREGENEEACELYTQASDIFESRLDDEGDMCLIHYAICQRNLSDIYRAEEENIQAHACLSRSIMLLESRVDELSDQLRLHLAVCCNARGTLRFQMGNYEGEVDDCTRSLQLREGLEQDSDAIATVLSNRAEAYYMLGRHEQAMDDFARAVEMFDSVPENRRMAASAATRCYSMGLLCAERDQPDQACGHFRAAAERLAALRAGGDGAGEYSAAQLTELEAYCRMRLGMTLSGLEERDYFEALTENREAIRLLEKLPESVDRVARLASLHIANGELMEMFDELEAAEREYAAAERCRSRGVELLLTASHGGDGEEDPEEDLENQRSIWENFSGQTPQA